MIIGSAKSRPQNSVLAVFLVLVVFLVDLYLVKEALWGEVSIPAYNALQDEVRDIKDEIKQTVIANKMLSREIRLLKNDPVAQECAIRERLNFIKDNEIIYIFTENTQKGGVLK